LESENTVHLPARLNADSFSLRPPAGFSGNRASVRMIDYWHRAVMRTTYASLELEVVDGEFEVMASDSEKTLNRLSVVERHGRHGGVSCALLRGFGLRAGALASTVSHDCHQLTVLGCSRQDMLIACQALAECGGGITAVRDGEVLATIKLPLAGLLSLRAAPQVAEEIAAFRQAVTQLGLPSDNTFMGIVSVTLAVIPQGKLTDLGLIDVERQSFLPLVM
jgi:adenine deaminase